MVDGIIEVGNSAEAGRREESVNVMLCCCGFPLLLHQRTIDSGAPFKLSSIGNKFQKNYKI